MNIYKIKIYLQSKIFKLGDDLVKTNYKCIYINNKLNK